MAAPSSHPGVLCSADPGQRALEPQSPKLPEPVACSRGHDLISSPLGRDGGGGEERGTLDIWGWRGTGVLTAIRRGKFLITKRNKGLVCSFIHLANIYQVPVMCQALF